MFLLISEETVSNLSVAKRSPDSYTELTNIIASLTKRAQSSTVCTVGEKE